MANTHTVTILFTDMVGSTELFTALGPNTADELRQTHFGLLRAAVNAAGGTEVKTLGDGLMVAFTSLSRALACAIAMQQSVERHNRRSEQPVAIRVGLSTGEATEDDGDYFGEPVIEASRLCALAESGQILTTAIARALAGRHATQEFEALGEMELKGLPYPVELVEVRWAPEVAGAGEGAQLPLPARLVTTPAESLFAFFGRADELAALGDLHKRSATEHRLGVVLISGEPGVGKTSLVAQAARSVHHGGATILYGGCDEDLAVPYKPWVEALTPLVQGLPYEVLRRFTKKYGLTLARLVPELTGRLGEQAPSPASESDAERFMVMESVVRFLTAASMEMPLLVVLDDLHWADAASLPLFGHLAHSSVPMAVTVVATFRDSDLSRSHPLTPFWRGFTANRRSSVSLSSVSRTSRSSASWNRPPATPCPRTVWPWPTPCPRTVWPWPTPCGERRAGTRSSARARWWPRGWPAWERRPNGRCPWPRSSVGTSTSRCFRRCSSKTSWS